LQEVQLAVREGPLDVTLRAVDPLTVVGQGRQSLQVLVPQAQRLHQVGCDLLVHGATVRRGTYRELLEPWTALEHLAPAGHPVGVGNDPARDHRLTQAPAGFDHSLVPAGDRVPREHHTRRLRLQQ
jgi:hypothetical protein